MNVPSIGVVVLAWRDEPYLTECLTSVVGSTGVDVRLVVVDNGCTPEHLAAALDALGPDAPVEVLRPGTNTGFAGGCNLGVAALGAGGAYPGYVALVNSDCVLEPDTLVQLVTEAARPGVGPVMASIRLAEPPYLLNSAGNPVHLVGLSWAGGLDTPETRTEPYDVTGASGACVVLSSALWQRLGGFDEAYFAYLEDTELSLRCLRMGLAARCVPTAIARHHYEFSRNANKMYLLERNRLMLVASLWSGRALALLAPLLLVVEVLLAGYAVASGWGSGKVRGWHWLWQHRAEIAARRRQLAAERRVPDREWMATLTPTLDRSAFGPLTPAANLLFRAYWQLVRRFV